MEGTRSGGGGDEQVTVYRGEGVFALPFLHLHFSAKLIMSNMGKQHRDTNDYYHYDHFV